MSDMKFTKEQQEAIDTRKKEILVSAAAGSGKTAVLVERIVLMLLHDHVSLENLVVLTFTNAAAAQMKERIRERLQTLLPTVTAEQQVFIQKQILLLPIANISTFHAYCIKTLRNYYQFVDLSPKFKIIEENMLVLLKEEALNQTLESILEQAKEYQILLDTFVTGNKLQRLEKIILEIYEKTRSYAFIDAWRKQALAYTNDDKAIKVITNAYINHFFQTLKDWKEQLSYLATIIPEFPKNQEGIFSVIEQLEYVSLQTYQQAMLSLQAIIFPKWASIKKDVATEMSKNAHSEFGRIKKEYTKFVKQLYTVEEIVEQQKQNHIVLKQLLLAVALFEQNLKALKEQKDFVDFSDLEHYMIALLTTHPEVRTNAASQITEILVDEYQDTNEVQDTILKLLHNEDNRLFMVGDIKQSIYRFRLADPTIFLDKKQKYQQQQSDDQQLILLNKNFRSSDTILSTVNSIFDTLFQLDIKYNDEERLYLGNTAYLNESSYYTKWHFFEQNENVHSLQTTDEKKAITIVNEIVRLVNKEKIYDEKQEQYRPITLNDIAILFRSRGSQLIYYLEQKLSEAMISYTSENDKGYFDAVEVNVVLALLNVLENPYNSIALLAYLRSPICQITDEELYQIAQLYRQEKGNDTDKYYFYFVYYMEQKHDALATKLQKIEQQLILFRERLSVNTLANVLPEIYQQTYYYNFVAALPNGNVRCANLDILVQLAKKQEELGKNGLYSFNKYIRNLQKNNRDFALAKVENEMTEAVQLMTIHKSKGLEFPIVFLIDLDKKFNEQDLRANYQMSKEFGLGLQYRNITQHTRYKTWHYEMIAQQIAYDMKAEELRVLYVALTRPMQHLHLFLDMVETKKQLQTEQDILSLTNYGTALRTIFEMQQQHFTTWSAQYENIEDSLQLHQIHLNTENKSGDEKQVTTEIPFAEKRKIIQKMQARYKYQDFQNYAQKQTVTELKSRLSMLETVDTPINELIMTNAVQSKEINQELYQKTPTFMQSIKEISPLEKGTLYHFILQCYDWQYFPDVPAYLNALVEQKMITAPEMQCLSIGHIEQVIHKIKSEFLDNEYKIIGQELPFSFAYKAKDIYGDALLSDETLLVQGKIDLLLAKDKNFVIIDFKTDKLISGQTAALLEKRYAKQMFLYKEAVKKFYETDNVSAKIYAIFG